MLSFIDEHWTEHLRGLDEVKEGIGLRAFGQRDPLVEYKLEAFKLFKEMMETINQNVVSFVFRAGPLVSDQAQQRARAQVNRSRLDPNRARSSHASSNPSYGVTGGGNSAGDRDPSAGQKTVVVGERIGRNDPCPCGSGKKYKHCHGKG
jgi:preprotein translocase subunit SecA